MNKHLNDGQLRAALDGEAGLDELHHLEDCQACRERKRLIHAQVRQAAEPLTFLTPLSTEIPAPALDASTALNHFRYRKLNNKETSMFKKLFASQPLRYALVAVLVLTIILSVPATRALADQLLSLFRVEQVTVVPIDYTGMQQLVGEGPVGQQASQLFSNSITITHKPAKPVQAADAVDASKRAGFTVRLPSGETTPTLTVSDSAAFTFKIDRTKAQALIDEAGRKDLVLPASIDGEQISISIPSGVSAGYGTCPTPTDGEATKSIGGGSAGRNYADCILLVEIPSPVVNAPADLDVAKLATIGLEFTGMTADQAAAFTSSVDWTSTLVIPIPKNAATYQQVPVDGVTGTLIQRPVDDVPQYSLIWVKNGVIYAISALGTGSDKAIQMANSLQ